MQLRPAGDTFFQGHPPPMSFCFDRVAHFRARASSQMEQRASPRDTILPSPSTAEKRTLGYADSNLPPLSVFTVFLLYIIILKMRGTRSKTRGGLRRVLGTAWGVHLLSGTTTNAPGEGSPELLTQAVGLTTGRRQRAQALLRCRDFGVACDRRQTHVRLSTELPQHNLQLSPGGARLQPRCRPLLFRALPVSELAN